MQAKRQILLKVCTQNIQRTLKTQQYKTIQLKMGKNLVKAPHPRIQLTTKQEKRCATLFVILKMQIEKKIPLRLMRMFKILQI